MKEIILNKIANLQPAHLQKVNFFTFLAQTKKNVAKVLVTKLGKTFFLKSNFGGLLRLYLH